MTEDIESFTTIQREIEALILEQKEYEKKELYQYNKIVFPAVALFQNDLNKSIQKMNKNPMIHICAYHIHQSGQHPFLQYFLYQEHQNQADLKFPCFPFSPDNDMVQQCLKCMNTMSGYFHQKNDYEYKGHIVHQGDMYVFFDCTTFNVDTVKMTRENELWLVSIDEIINTRMLCDIPIHSKTVNFFLENKECLYLMNTLNEIYETPTIVYTSCPLNRIDFYTTFGIPYSHEGDNGPGYYFNHHFHDIPKGQGAKGVLRVALFLQNVQITPIYDINSTQWKEEYDSLYTQTESGIPVYVVKDYEQQYVLSSQWIQ